MQNVNLVLGTMTFGESVFLPEAEEFINKFIDMGYNEFDTAYVYNEGNSERILGEIFNKINHPYKLATKVNPRITGKLDGEAAYKQVNESLERLQLDFVDIEYLHFPDPITPVESVLAMMNELHQQGKFKELGLSNYPAWMVGDICHLCDKHGWVKPTVYQGVYNPLTRKAEGELNACLNHFGLRFYAYNPMAGGLLTGKYSEVADEPAEGRFTHRPNYRGRYWKKSYFDAVNIIQKTAEKYDVSLIEATYRWLAYHSMLDGERGDSILVGVSKLNHLQENISAIKNGSLPEEFIEAFDRAWDISRPDSPEYFTMFKGTK